MQKHGYFFQKIVNFAEEVTNKTDEEGNDIEFMQHGMDLSFFYLSDIFFPSVYNICY